MKSVADLAESAILQSLVDQRMLAEATALVAGGHAKLTKGSPLRVAGTVTVGRAVHRAELKTNLRLFKSQELIHNCSCSEDTVLRPCVHVIAVALLGRRKAPVRRGSKPKKPAVS